MWWIMLFVLVGSDEPTLDDETDSVGDSAVVQETVGSATVRRLHRSVEPFFPTETPVFTMHDSSTGKDLTVVVRLKGPILTVLANYPDSLLRAYAARGFARIAEQRLNPLGDSLRIWVEHYPSGLPLLQASLPVAALRADSTMSADDAVRHMTARSLPRP